MLRNILKLASKINPLLEMFEPRILKCNPKCEAQLIHGDKTSYVDEENKTEHLDAMVVLGIVALDENTTIDVSTGSFFEQIHIPRGNGILLKSRESHRGSANNLEIPTYRLHFLLKSHNVKFN